MCTWARSTELPPLAPRPSNRPSLRHPLHHARPRPVSCIHSTMQGPAPISCTHSTMQGPDPVSCTHSTMHALPPSHAATPPCKAPPLSHAPPPPCKAGSSACAKCLSPEAWPQVMSQNPGQAAELNRQALGTASFPGGLSTTQGLGLSERLLLQHQILNLLNKPHSFIWL